MFTPPKCGFTPSYGYRFYSSVSDLRDDLHTFPGLHRPSVRYLSVFTGHFFVIGGHHYVIGAVGAFLCQVESRYPAPGSRLRLYVLFTSK